MSGKKMEAKYAGKCRSCGGDFPIGTGIVWEKGIGSAHQACPTKASAQPAQILSSVPLKPATGSDKVARNKKYGDCYDCQEPLKPGEGQLVFCMEDGGCMEHFDRSGYHVFCLPSQKGACAQRRADLKVARAKYKAEQAANAAATAVAKAAADAAHKGQVTALLTGLEQTTAYLPEGTVKGPVMLRRAERGSTQTFQEATLASGEKVIVEEFYCSDDGRSYVHATPVTARTLRLATAAKLKITSESAREWLKKYSGCDGADIYRAVMEGS